MKFQVILIHLKRCGLHQMSINFRLIQKLFYSGPRVSYNCRTDIGIEEGGKQREKALDHQRIGGFLFIKNT